jgi:hypothetical protein
MLFTCTVNEMQVPLGFVLRGAVTGLDIQYEMILDETNIMKNPFKDKTIYQPSSPSNSPRMRRSTFKSAPVDKSFTYLSFTNIKVNKAYYFSFTIKNLSGITTYFNLYCKNYPINIQEIESESERSGNTSFTKSSKKRRSILGKLKKEPISHMLLSNAHEANNFSSVLGDEFNKMKNNEKESNLYLSNKKGVALKIEPGSGKIEAFSSVIIKLSIYNECVGNFEDELVCEIKGLPAKRFPISMRIRGNPIQLSPFQPGIDYTINPPTMKMGYVLTKVNTIEKKLKLVNTGSNPLSIDWKVFDYDDVLNPKRDIYKIRITDQNSSTSKYKYSLLYNPLPPIELNLGDKQFNVFPQTSSIDPKCVKDFMIDFHTHEQGLRSALLVGYPNMLEEESGDKHSKVKMSEVAIKVDAFGIQPYLTVDKHVRLY